MDEDEKSKQRSLNMKKANNASILMINRFPKKICDNHNNFSKPLALS